MKELSKEEIKSWFLMQKIKPAPEIGCLFKNKKLETVPYVSEIGVYGYIFSEPGKLIKNETGEILVRSKMMKMAEGGIAAGYGCLDSMIY